MSLGIGEGRNGGNALVVTANDSSQGLPAFWVRKGYSTGGSYANYNTEEGYIVPRGKRANRLEFYVRFQSGFRLNYASAQPPEYPNHQNMHFGTYHFDPAKIDGGTAVKESDNWHYYHQIFLRHDKADEDWIRVVLNEVPQHQRSKRSVIPDNPTMPSGNYWELLTRFYFECVPYFSDPEIEYPVKMWVDDIGFYYEEETPPVEIDFVGYEQGDYIEMIEGEIKEFAVNLTNTGNSEVCGRLGLATDDKLNVSMDTVSGPILNGDQVCIPPGNTIIVTVTANPSGNDVNLPLGITFAENDQFLDIPGSRSPSLSDNNVEKRWYHLSGPHDGLVSGDFIMINVN